MGIKTFRQNMKDGKQRKNFFKIIRDNIRCASCQYLKNCKFRYLPDHTINLRTPKLYCQKDHDDSIEKMKHTKFS